jgi:quercetin dioxygenase-like cupin family protein
MAIEKVIYQKKFDSHENDDRLIATLVNGDILGFVSEQVRVTRFKRDTVLGHHWREYPELYGVLGQANFTLEDIDTRQRAEYELNTGDRLFIPPRVALKTRATEGTTVFVCAPKSNRNEGTHKYNIR